MHKGEKKFKKIKLKIIHVNLERGLKGQAVTNIFPQAGPYSGNANIKHDQQGDLGINLISTIDIV